MKPHVVVIGGVWPHVKGNREAANVVSHLILQQLAEQGQFRLTFQYLNWNVTQPSEAARPELDALAAQGVGFAPPVGLGKPVRLLKRPVGAVPALATDGWAALASGVEHRRAVAAALRRLSPDLVLTVWSELAQNLVGHLPYPKIAYAGNPDYKVFAANRELGAQTSPPMRVLEDMKARLTEAIVQHSHVSVMRGFDRVLNVAKNDAEDYRSFGIDADYIQNMWPAAIPANWSELRDRSEQETPLRILGNVGNLSATGNSFGLLTIARDILPRLKAKLGEGRFEIHLFGGGEVRPAIAPLLRDPHICIRGFVDDLDAEILAAPIFLVANNHCSFKVGHTRFLHAWSSGACCIGFDDSREAMPEIRHERNVLLGADPDALVSEIARAATDRSLRRRIGAGGVSTLQREFAPRVVVGRIEREIDALLARRPAAKSG